MERAGTRDTLVVVQTASPGTGAGGVPVDSWMDHGQFWVSVEFREPDQVTRNEMSIEREVRRFRFDWLDAQGLSRSMRIVFDGVGYDITAIDRSSDTRKTVMVTAAASLSDGQNMKDAVARDLREGIILTVVRQARNAADIEVKARAKVEQYKVDEVVGGINQGDRRITISAPDLASLPGGLKDGDDLIMPDGQRLTAIGVDSYTLRIGDQLFAYLLTGRGA